MSDIDVCDPQCKELLERERQAHATTRQRLADAEMLVGMLGHDLRDPLGALSASTGLLLRRGGLPDPAVRVLTGMASSVQRMGRMIGQMLDFTRVRLGGGLVLDRKPTDLAELCEQVRLELAQLRPSRAVELSVDGDTVGEWDADRLSRVVHNLVANAVQYGTADQPVRVEVKSDGEQVCFAVHNRGDAIPSEVRGGLFQPFRRVSRNSPGLGLGLYIAHQIVRAHGGTIEVESSAAEGTTFRFSLPRRE